MTTGVPSSRVPAASLPRIIGYVIPSGWPLIPRSVKRSWRFRLPWVTFTRTHPSGTSGSGRSPIFSAESGSSGAACVAYTANICLALLTGHRPSRDDFQQRDLVAVESEEEPKIHGAARRVAGDPARDDGRSA